MLTLESTKGVEFCDGLTRRDFLRAGALAAGGVGLSLAELQASGAAGSGERSCILLFLVGGPSHLDTFDPKPDAPDEVRGPFRPVSTNVPGIAVGEHFPLLAARADRCALVRSVHHHEAPIHETGHQLMQTGRLFRGGQEHPHYGSVLAHVKGAGRDGLPPFVVLPGPVGNTGVSVSHGQTAASLGTKHEPFYLHADAEPAFTVGGLDPARLPEPRALLRGVDNAQRAFDVLADCKSGLSPACHRAFSGVTAEKAKRAFFLGQEKPDVQERYGRNTFGQSCLLARRLVEHGVRLVTVNMFDTVFNNLTWDCHADNGALPTRLDDYRDTLCPMFDRAYAALLDDLEQRGLLGDTLVVAFGEFGRTPKLNPRGGRDHWPGCWTVLFAGGGVRGGQVVGASDATGSEPKDRPVTPAEVAATVYQSLGVDLNTRLRGPDGRPLPLVEAAPIAELFRG